MKELIKIKMLMDKFNLTREQAEQITKQSNN